MLFGRISLYFLFLIFGTSIAASQNAPSVVSTPQQLVSQQKLATQKIIDYWTPDRMKNAKDRDLERLTTQPSIPSNSRQLLNVNEAPSLVRGWNPGSKTLPQKSGVLIPLKSSSSTLASPTALTSFGSAPSNPTDYANYGPFQRWTWFGNYLNYPISTIGKIFFTQDGLNYVCSGTVVGQNTIVTAGHCVKNGSGSWSTNIVFCPSYYALGVNSVGCWAWTGYASTSSYWGLNDNLDGDYACFVTATSGTAVASSIGLVTGWLGVGYNWPSQQSVFSTGYPQGSPFNGTNIIFTAATEWYQIVNSKYIGSDQTGGTSGGSWWLNMAHKAKEYADVDGSNTTDPGQNIGTPFVNGVNSHRRCLVNCNSPPTSSNGLYWSEIGSPVFYSSGADAADTSDVLNSCFNNGG